jgi:hypothetical protein
MKITKTQLKQIIKEEIAALSEGLNPDKVHVFKRLKSGKWGKVYWPEGEKLPDGHIKVPANKQGFPYDDYDERQETLDKM